MRLKILRDAFLVESGNACNSYFDESVFRRAGESFARRIAMQGFPCERGDPLFVSRERLPHLLTLVGIPKAYLAFSVGGREALSCTTAKILCNKIHFYSTDKAFACSLASRSSRL